MASLAGVATVGVPEKFPHKNDALSLRSRGHDACSVREDTYPFPGWICGTRRRRGKAEKGRGGFEFERFRERAANEQSAGR